MRIRAIESETQNLETICQQKLDALKSLDKALIERTGTGVQR